MKSLEEAIGLDPEGILEEIRERQSLIMQMMGSLYPSILNGEILKLDQEYRRKKYGAPARL